MTSQPFTDFDQAMQAMNKAIAGAAVAMTAAAETIGLTAETVRRSSEAIVPLVNAASRRSSEGIVSFPRIAPVPCWGCRNYVGFANNRGERLVCGMHPEGPEEKVCRDSTLRVS